MAANPVAIAVRAERHKRLHRGEKIAHPGRMDSGIAPTDRSALMDAPQDSQLHRNRLGCWKVGGPWLVLAQAGSDLLQQSRQILLDSRDRLMLMRIERAVAG